MTGKSNREELPLMRGLPKADDLAAMELVLASGSPRRSELMAAAGYRFRVVLPDDAAEDLPRPGEPAEEVVKRLAYQKGADVARRLASGRVIAADTIGVCDNILLGKPADADDARRMLRLLRGREHHVLTGICLWDVEESRRVIEAVRTDLAMDAISDAEIERYIETDRWRGKAAGFGYQDANDWLRVLPGGSESNVVGLPMERLAYWLQQPEAWPRVSDTEWER